MAATLALTPDGRWTASLDEVLQVTSAAGFGALGLSAASADASTPQRFAEAGLSCHEILALMVTDDAEVTLASAALMASAAATMGAPWVLTVFAAPLSDVTAPIIADAAAIFADVGAKMAVEFSPLGPVATLALGLEVVEAAGPSRAGIMIDSWHFLTGQNRLEELELLDLEAIAYVQFADALAPISERLGSETMNRRALPGEGVLEIEPFVAALRDRGYEGIVSLEVLSAELRELPLAEFTRRAYDTAAGFWF